ncbi:MAG: tyrosine-type recombinase/integrase [Acidimicrobiales bacterium]
MGNMDVVGAAHLSLVDGATYTNPEATIFEAMLDGWRAQQLARSLSFATIDSGARVVRRFSESASTFPWEWTSSGFDTWSAELRKEKRAPSTLRGYQASIRAFLGYVCDPAYGWDGECINRFGTHAVQICNESNMGAHVVDYEGRPERRSMTRAECQDLFDAADARADRIRLAGRKGWVPAFRDATMLKVTYAWGLRRRELVMLERHDFGVNPKASEFGDFGVCNVRYGKAANGSGPRRRGVLTVMPWSTEVMDEWATDIWPGVRQKDSAGLWPSERDERVSEDRVNSAFARAARDAGLPAGLSPHSLRHSYVTHLIEDGFDVLFVQQQVGHRHASTTAIYTSVSADYRTRMLRSALDAAVNGPARQNGIGR